MFDPGLSLETSLVWLRPMEENDFASFHQLAQDHDAWTYFSHNLADATQLRIWMDLCFADREAQTRHPFTIIEKASGAPCGSMSMGKISFYDLRLEIGWSWLSAAYRGTQINLHAKFAMMQHAFEIYQFERVEFKTDVLNARARRGLEKIGGQKEGVFRSHMTMWNNRRRSSVYYSVLRNEWGTVKGIFFKGLE